MSEATRIFEDIDPASGVGQFIAALDRLGVTVADARISIWTLLVALVVIIVAVLFARLAIRAARWLLGKIHGIDTTQQLLAPTLITTRWRVPLPKMIASSAT